MSAEKWRVLGIMLIAALAVSAGEALLARGMKLSSQLEGGFWTQAKGVLTNGHVVFGTALMATYFGLYMLSLRWADLSFVLPITAVSYLLGAAFAKWYLGENVTPTRWLGVVVITMGVIIVGFGEGGATPSP